MDLITESNPWPPFITVNKKRLYFYGLDNHKEDAKDEANYLKRQLNFLRKNHPKRGSYALVRVRRAQYGRITPLAPNCQKCRGRYAIYGSYQFWIQSPPRVEFDFAWKHLKRKKLI